MTSIETAREKLPVLLSIRGEQYFDDVDPDATELMTEGTLELTEEDALVPFSAEKGEGKDTLIRLLTEKCGE